MIGNNSPLSSSLKSFLRTNQAVGAGVGIATDGAGNGVSNTIEKKEE